MKVYLKLKDGDVSVVGRVDIEPKKGCDFIELVEVFEGVDLLPIPLHNLKKKRFEVVHIYDKTGLNSWEYNNTVVVVEKEEDLEIFFKGLLLF